MPKKEPLYPHVPKSRKPSRNDVEVYLSLPPYKVSIWVEKKKTGKTIWQLEGAENINRFGWKDQNRDQLEESVLKHLEDIGVLSESSEVKREYTPQELAGIAKVFYEAQTRRRQPYLPLLPLYTSWESLAQSQRDETIRGLQERIEREGLEGYLERKRPEVGDELTEEIVHELERQGYL